MSRHQRHQPREYRERHHEAFRHDHDQQHEEAFRTLNRVIARYYRGDEMEKAVRMEKKGIYGREEEWRIVMV
ncbi:hypothetical protein A0H81_09982 [Grifola frondosa]|uniref:Uncharacterized protein n=1 Tax=Grifola frondosa TaxID=5627 RepID=A0A1C7LZJ8_GRIFR|nr:hypothetical protein A0H81_09982 [Grifola frondosa]